MQKLDNIATGIVGVCGVDLADHLISIKPQDIQAIVQTAVQIIIGLVTLYKLLKPKAKQTEPTNDIVTETNN